MPASVIMVREYGIWRIMRTFTAVLYKEEDMYIADIRLRLL